MQILHLSADYPDPLVPGKTAAISRLLRLVPEFDHRVYSLNRIGPGSGIQALSFETHHRAVAYGAPPFGLWHQTYLDKLARWIMRDIRHRALAPAAIHAHKLSVEALVGDQIARSLDVPLIVSCQGNSDLKIIRAKRGLRPAWRKIWERANWVLPFAPWTASALERLLGPRKGPMTMLPCPTEADDVFAPRTTGPIIRTAFNLDQSANKNVGTLIKATALAAKQCPELRLEIVGAGSPHALAKLQRLVNPHQDHVAIAGPVEHYSMQHVLNHSACFVLPSRRESYGMVFAEAMLAGCPVVHGAGNGISGYFPDATFAQPARQRGAKALAAQLLELIDTQPQVKADLARAQERGDLDILRRPAITESYRQVLYTVTEIADIPRALYPTRPAQKAPMPEGQ